MGYFNMMGFYSNIPIRIGDKIAVFLCIENMNGYDSIGTFTNFIPLAPPIIGEYDDYGRVCNINRDGNIEQIEKFFGEDITQIVRLIDDFNNCRSSIESVEYKTVIDWFETKLMNMGNDKKNICLVMEHYDIYNKLKSVYDKPYCEITSFDLLFRSSIGEYWLNKLGFVKSEYYGKQIFVHPSNSDYYLIAVGNGCPKIYKFKNKTFSIPIYNGIPRLIKEWKKLTKFELSINNEYDKKISYVELCWDKNKALIDAFNKIDINEMIKRSILRTIKSGENSFIDTIKFIVKTVNLDEKKIEEIMDILNKNTYVDVLLFNSLYKMFNYEPLMNVYSDVDIFNETLRDSICDMVKFSLSLTYLNIQLKSNSYGGQNNNFEYHLGFHEEIVDLIKKFKDEYKYEDDED